MALYFKSCLVWLKFAVHGRKMQNKESDQMSKFHVDIKARYSHVHVYTAVHISKLAVPSWSKWSFLEQVFTICSYNELWDFPTAGSSSFLPRFSLLTFFRFLGPFFIFSEIFTSNVL